jgi:hypothetical protein
MFTKTPVALSFVLTLAGALSAHAADTRPTRDFSDELHRAERAVLGQVAELDGVHFYQGRGRQGGACIVTAQYSRNSLSVGIKAKGAASTHRDELTVDLMGHSRDVTALGVSVKSGKLEVAIAESNQYAYQLQAQFDASENGIGRLQSVSVFRDEKGKKAEDECGSLRPILALDEKSLADADAAASAEYIRQNPDDRQRGEGLTMDVGTCTLDGPEGVTCDASLPTDYAADTAHITLGIRQGKLSGEVTAIDFEPGC